MVRVSVARGASARRQASGSEMSTAPAANACQARAGSPALKRNAARLAGGMLSAFRSSEPRGERTTARRPSLWACTPGVASRSRISSGARRRSGLSAEPGALT